MTGHARHAPFKQVEASRPPFDAAAHPTYTRTPQPDWQPGGGLNDLASSEAFRPENATWRSVDPNATEKMDLYKMMISAIQPRPIAFVSSVSSEGKFNLAPFSFFNMVAPDPPTIMISVSVKPTGLKDTNRNIRDRKEFCVSIISETFLEAANYTGVDAPTDVDEWTLSGLTQRKSETISVPHVAEAAFSMECTLEHWHEIKNDAGEVTYTTIFGRVRRFQAKEFIFDDRDTMRILPEKLRAVSRMGGITYGRTLEMVELPRMVWSNVKEDEDVQELLDPQHHTV